VVKVGFSIEHEKGPCTPSGFAVSAMGKRLLYRIALVLLVAWCALIAFPALPPPTGLGLDPSWVLGINLAHVQGLAMGRDLVWTYGPLAFLSIPNPAGQHIWPGFLYRMSMYLLWCAVLLRLCVWLVPPLCGFWMATLFGIVAAMDPFLAGDHLEAAALVLSLTILVDESRWKSIELFLLSLLAAAAMLVRYNLGVELIGVFLALALQKDVRRQAFPAIAALPIAILGLYVAATGHITSLWPYFRNGWELASGYSEAMSVPGPPLAVFATLVALVCVFGAALWISPRCPRGWGAMAAAAILAFFLFKNSTVRQDGPHVAPFFGKLALISLFFWIPKSTRRSAASLVAFQIALLSTGYLFLDHVWPGMLPRVLSRLSLSETARLARDYFHWPQTWRRFEAEALRNLQPGWLPAPFHKAVGSGTVDAVPWNVSGVIANGWRWQPRPVFQSYAAFTPVLDHLNARHIQSAAAADFALVNWETIDSRHPFFEDPSSWRARLDRYASDYSDNHALLMRRRASPVIRSSEHLNSATIRWGQDAAVPPYDDWVVLHANVRPTPFGKLRKLLFRLDPIWLNVRFRSGHSQRWRAIRPNLENGILMNQLPQDLGDISLLGRGCALPDPVVSVWLEASRPQDYASDIAIEWEGLRAPQSPRAVVFDENNPCLAPQPSVGSFPAWGGAGALTVTAGSGAVWNVTTNSPWLSISSGAAGQGNRIVSYVVAANPNAAARTDIVHLERVPYRVEQFGLPAGGEGVQLGLFRIGGQAMPASSGQAPGFGDIVDSFGLLGDLPVMGDWNGDGRIRVGVYRKGDWYLDLNGNRKWDGVEGGDGIFQFGLPGDTPVVGDWTGDGVTKLGVFRCPQDPHAECTWALDINGNRRFDANDVFLRYGLPGDIPTVSAWSGGKIDKIGVFRNGVWFIDSNGNGRFDPSDQRLVFGAAGDMPVVSRSRGKIGVYRSGKWLLDWNGDRRWDAGDREFVFGNPHDRPLIAEW
jgi:hypothetical protein